jgi:hypothetical protein
MRCPLALVVVVVFASAPALAQQSEADKLFDEGAALMKQNKYADACPKFEQSNKLDPEVGGMLWLADCYERNNQTASAYRTYQDAQKMAIDRKDKQQRDKVAQKHLASLEPHLAKLTLLPPQAGRPSGLEVTRDGVKLADDGLGLAFPVDPGQHVVTAIAPSYKKWEQKIEVTGEGATVTVTLGPLEKEQVAGPPPVVVENSDPGFAFHVGGIVLGAVGLVSIGVGSVLGLVAANKLSASNANGHCDAADTCDSVGLGLRSQAEGAALGSTVLFIAGGVVLVAGITVFFIAPKKKRAEPTFAVITPAFGNGFYGMAATGRF